MKDVFGSGVPRYEAKMPDGKYKLGCRAAYFHHPL
jgi:hypothetical protein